MYLYSFYFAVINIYQPHKPTLNKFNNEVYFIKIFYLYLKHHIIIFKYFQKWYNNRKSGLSIFCTEGPSVTWKHRKYSLDCPVVSLCNKNRHKGDKMKSLYELNSRVNNIIETLMPQKRSVLWYNENV